MTEMKHIAMSALVRVFKVASIFAAGCTVGSAATIFELSTARVEQTPNGFTLRKDGPNLKYKIQIQEPQKEEE